MSVTLNRVGGTFVSSGDIATSIDGVAVPNEEVQRTVTLVETAPGIFETIPGTAARGLRVDARRAVTTAVYKIDPIAGPVVARPAMPERRTIKIHYDAPATKRVFIREGGGVDDITADNWSYPLKGGETYEPFTVSDGIYQLWWEDQDAPSGGVRVTEG